MFDFKSRVSLLLAAAFLTAAGCKTSPEARMVGIWTLEGNKSRFPKAPIPGLERRFADFKRNFRLKLLADQTLVLTGAGTAEGKWSYQGGQLKIDLKDDFMKEIFEKAKVDVAPNQESMTILSQTPIGEVSLALHKTG